MEEKLPESIMLLPNESHKNQFSNVSLSFDSEITPPYLLIGLGSLFITDQYFSFNFRRLFWVSDNKSGVEKVLAHYKDVVFYGLKQGKDLEITVQIKGTSLSIIEEKLVNEKIISKEESDSEGEQDDYENQGQIYIKPGSKDDGI